MTKSLQLIFFIALTLGLGFLSSLVSGPVTSYASFNKPWFAPPAWIFPIAWTFLYLLIGTAGFLTWRRDAHSTPMRLWWLQLALNIAWSPVFFRFDLKLAALGVIVVLLGTIIAFIITSWRAARLPALLFIPYAAWVSFATVLNGAIVRLN